MAFQSLLDEIKGNLRKVLSGLSIPDVKFTVEPAKLGFGDASSNAPFLLAKHLQKSPYEIAVMLAEKYADYSSTFVLRAEAHRSGNLNFSANWERLSQMILSESYLDEFGSVDVGGNSSLVVEHTSVNPNKALHIGHIRNIIVGDSLARILAKANYNVRVLNYVDDSGVQVADIIVGFRHFGFDENPPEGKKFDHYCGDDVYVKTTQRYETKPELKDLRKRILVDLEDGGSETAKFADRITQRVLANQLETCWNLSASYDCLNFESQIMRSGLWGKIFEKLKQLNLIEFEDNGKNAGCWVIRGDAEEDKVIVRSDGTATYIAKDIPYAAWKLGLVDDPFLYQRYGKEQKGRVLWQTALDSGETSQNFTGERAITVIDSRQVRLQKFVTSLLTRFKSVPDAYVHLSYESVTLSPDTARVLGMNTSGKKIQMSGRHGLYVSADSVYDMLKQKTRDETIRRNPEMKSSEIEDIAHCVSVGTLRYEMIKQDLDKIITFDLTKSLSLEGDTAPYIQYTHARASRIVEKSGSIPTINVDFSLLREPSELELVRMIGMFGICVRDSANNLSPKVVARYCHDLAVAFNSFYEKTKVLDLGDEKLESLRLCLVNSFKITVEKSLGLIGIAAPDRM